MSTAKKYNRRKQKKDFLDEQDLQAQQIQQQMQKNTLPVQTDLFEVFFLFNSKQAAKLQQNYFVRSNDAIKLQDSHQNLDHFNLDEDEKENQSEIQDKQNQNYVEVNLLKNNNNKYALQTGKQIKEHQDDEEQQKKKKNQKTDKKRRRKPIKAKKQSIFDDDQESGEQNQQATQQKHLNQIKQTIEQTKKQSSQIPQSNQKPHSLNLKDERNSDDFDNIIKKQQEQHQQPEQQQTIVHLHLILNSMTKQQRKQYYYQPLKPGEVSLGYFKRSSSGLSEIYHFLGQDHRPLMFCENQRGCIGCNYYISMTKEMDKNKFSYLGKLRGNATGSVYNLYDSGAQPKNQINRFKWRVSLAAIEYESNFMGFNGPRKLKVTTPSPKHFEDPDTFKLSEEQSILNFKPPVIAEFRNKTPKWNDKLKSYALNFGGRVKLASIKNFILISNQYQIQEQEQADNVIIFGKVDQNTFSLEYRYPLSMYQAFGIIMSEFDFKLNCE